MQRHHILVRIIGMNQNKSFSINILKSRYLVVNDTHTCPLYLYWPVWVVHHHLHMLHWVLIQNIQVVIPFATFDIVWNLTTITCLKVITQGQTTKLSPSHSSCTHIEDRPTTMFLHTHPIYLTFKSNNPILVTVTYYYMHYHTHSQH